MATAFTDLKKDDVVHIEPQNLDVEVTEASGESLEIIIRSNIGISDAKTIKRLDLGESASIHAGINLRNYGSRHTNKHNRGGRRGNLNHIRLTFTNDRIYYDVSRIRNGEINYLTISKRKKFYAGEQSALQYSSRS